MHMKSPVYIVSTRRAKTNMLVISNMLSLRACSFFAWGRGHGAWARNFAVRKYILSLCSMLYAVRAKHESGQLRCCFIRNYHQSPFDADLVKSRNPAIAKV